VAAVVVPAAWLGLRYRSRKWHPILSRIFAGPLSRPPTDRVAAFPLYCVVSAGAPVASTKGLEWREKPVLERLTYALVKGIPDFIDEGAWQPCGCGCGCCCGTGEGGGDARGCG